MKINKFGKLQKRILETVTRSKGRGRLLPVVHRLAFPGNTYPLSYVVPVLLRMEHQQLIKVVWDRENVKMSRVYLKGERHGPRPPHSP